jgi:CheY-like chemotaxis protein
MNKFNIWVIDDEEAYLKIFYENIHNKFEDINIKMLLIDDDGEKQLQELIENLFKIDILLIDWEMPQYTGEELIDKIFQNINYKNALKRPTIILNTQYWKDTDKCINSMKAGADDCVTFDKYEFSKLCDLIAKHIELKKERNKVDIKLDELIKKQIVF